MQYNNTKRINNKIFKSNLYYESKKLKYKLKIIT